MEALFKWGGMDRLRRLPRREAVLKTNWRRPVRHGSAKAMGDAALAKTSRSRNRPSTLTDFPQFRGLGAEARHVRMNGSGGDPRHPHIAAAAACNTHIHHRHTARGSTGARRSRNGHKFGKHVYILAVYGRTARFGSGHLHCCCRRYMGRFYLVALLYSFVLGTQPIYGRLHLSSRSPTAKIARFIAIGPA